MIGTTKNKSLAYWLLSITTVIWGAGFLFNNIALQSGAQSGFLNFLRFAVASILLAVIFNKKITLSKQQIVYGVICGVALFFAFLLQLWALEYTTPANSGFFTSFYVVFVVFLHWLLTKKRPTWITLLGVVLSIVGLAILNFGNTTITDKQETALLGNLMTLGAALFLAIQIVASDHALKKHNLDTPSLTFWQIVFATTLFGIYTAIFETGSTNWEAIDWNNVVLPIAFVAILGTAFAYPSQIFAQKHLHPASCSLIMSLEGVFGAVISVIFGADKFSWPLLIGGLLATGAIVLVEVVPSLKK